MFKCHFKETYLSESRTDGTYCILKANMKVVSNKVYDIRTALKTKLSGLALLAQNKTRAASSDVKEVGQNEEWKNTCLVETDSKETRKKF